MMGRRPVRAGWNWGFALILKLMNAGCRMTRGSGAPEMEVVAMILHLFSLL